MTTPSHDDLIREQFTRQAVPFATAPGIKDEQALRLLVEFSTAGPGDTVLDVACGPGIVACALARIARRVEGIDLTPAMIEQARALQERQGLANVSWRVGSVLSLPYPDASFSLVVSRYSFHHFLDPLAVLVEMKRVCAPGGRVVLADVAASADPARRAAYNRMEKLRDPSHVHALPLSGLEDLFRAAGFPSPRQTFYRFEVDLEGVLERSFPAPGGAETIRELFEASLASDGLGVSARREGGKIVFAYPIAVLAATR